MENKYLNTYNFTDNIMDDYMFYDQIKPLEQRLNLNLQEYVEIINGYNVIKVSIVKNFLLLHDDNYREFVVDEILYDIDKFGYYAKEYIDDAIYEVSMILDSDVLEHIDEKLHDAVCVIREACQEKDLYTRRKTRSKHK